MIRLAQSFHALRFLLLICAALALAFGLAQVGAAFVLDVGSAEATGTTGLYAPEQANTRTFRQSQPVAQLPTPLIEHLAELRLTLAGNAPTRVPLTLTLGAQAAATAQVTPGFRTYYLLASPLDRPNPLNLTLYATPFREPNANGRELGVAVDRLTITSIPGYGQRPVSVRLLLRMLGIALLLHVLLLSSNPRRQRYILGATLPVIPLIFWVRTQSIAQFAILISLLLAGLLLACAIIVMLRLGRGPARLPQLRLKLHPVLATVIELAAWSIVSAVMTYPLILNLSTAFPDKLDSYLNSWILAWDHYQLWRNPLRLFDANILYPYPKTLAQSEHLLGLYPLTGPLFALGLSPAVVHNLAIVLAFVLCAFGMRLLVRNITGSTTAAIVAGLIYAFYPYRVLQMAHLQQVSAQWMPFTFWALEHFRRERSWGWAGLAGIFFLLQSLVSYYHAIFLGILVVVYGLFFLITDTNFRTKETLFKLSIVGILILLVHIPLAQPYLYLQQRLGFQRSLTDSVDYAAALTDYLTPFGFNELYRVSTLFLDALAPYPAALFTDGLGDWQLVSGRPTQETLLFVGVLPLALAIIGGFGLRRRRIVQAMALALGVSFVLSLGPVLRIDWQRPPILNTMPYSLLPITRIIRAPARFVLAEILALAVLSGCGVVVLLSWLRRNHARLVGPTSLLLLLLVAGELARVPVQLYPIKRGNESVQQWLSAQPAGLVLHLPAGTLEDEARYEFYSTADFRPMLNGYSGYFDLPTFHRFLGRLRSGITARDVQMLQGLGLRYLVLHEDTLSEDEARNLRVQLQQLSSVSLAARFPNAQIYELAPDPWMDQIETYLGDNQSLYISDGGDLPDAYAELIALRLHSFVNAGTTTFGYRKLAAQQNGSLPAYGLFGVNEDPSRAGYTDTNIVWRNDLFKLIRR